MVRSGVVVGKGQSILLDLWKAVGVGDARLRANLIEPFSFLASMSKNVCGVQVAGVAEVEAHKPQRARHRGCFGDGTMPKTP